MNNRTIGMIVVLIGVICLTVGGIFIWQSLSLHGQVVTSMQIEKATYTGQPERITPDGEVIEVNKQINGIIDTMEEAKLMADTLQAHRLSEYPPYTEMDRDDPNRDVVINGMVLQNLLVTAEIGFGVSTLALGVGLFMVVVGIALGGIGLVIRRR